MDGPEGGGQQNNNQERMATQVASKWGVLGERNKIKDSGIDRNDAEAYASMVSAREQREKKQQEIPSVEQIRAKLIADRPKGLEQIITDDQLELRAVSMHLDQEIKRMSGQNKGQEQAINNEKNKDISPQPQSTEKERKNTFERPRKLRNDRGGRKVEAFPDRYEAGYKDKGIEWTIRVFDAAKAEEGKKYPISYEDNNGERRQSRINRQIEVVDKNNPTVPIRRYYVDADNRVHQVDLHFDPVDQQYKEVKHVIIGDERKIRKLISVSEQLIKEANANEGRRPKKRNSSAA